jgi:hypothetical protein
MPFQVVYDAELDCVVTNITGDINKELVASFFMEVGRVATENNCKRVLSDLRAGKITAPTIDIYEMAGSLDEKKIKRSFRRAIVISEDHQDYDFWETVCYNQGQPVVKIFTDYEQAKNWVLMK